MKEGNIMNFKKIAKLVTAAAVSISLLGCGYSLNEQEQESLFAEVFGTSGPFKASEASNQSSNNQNNEIYSEGPKNDYEPKTEPTEVVTRSQQPVEQAKKLVTHIVSCGQADTTIVQYGSKGLIIDAGAIDSAKLLDYMSTLDIKSYDMILTHYDLDHIASVDEILATYQVGVIYGPEYKVQSDSYSAYNFLVNSIKKNGKVISHPNTSDIVTLADNVTYKFVGPVKNYQEENSNSICIVLKYGADSYFFGGDATEEAEADMTNIWGSELDIDIYHVNHHGSSTSSSDVFLKALSPDACVISAGEGNEYDLPNSKVLGKLLAHKVYRTDKQGTIIITSDGSGTYNFNVSAWQPDSKYILNTKTLKIHLPDCKHISEIYEKNRQESTEDISKLINAGYTTCTECIN